MEIYEKETVTCAEMKELERLADEAGLSYYQMMENAGTGAAAIILSRLRTKSQAGDLERLGDTAHRKAVCYCGKGNNGGDGFVIARKFRKAGLDVTVVLVEGEPVTTDAVTNYGLLDGCTICELAEMEAIIPEEFGPHNPIMRFSADVVVDAIYGTGFHGTLRPAGQTAVAQIEAFRKRGALVAAIDIPSGLAGDEPDAAASSVTADMTISFHAKKPAHDDPSVAERMGEVMVCDIGIGKALAARDWQKPPAGAEEELVIRKTVFSDLAFFDEWERRPAVTQFFSIPENQSTEALYEKYFADLRDPGALQFTILLEQDGAEPRPIGRIVLADVIEGWKGEIWRIYIADEELRGRGLGRRAMKWTLDYCFHVLELERVYLDYYTGNPAQYLYESMGFTHEGLLRKNCRKNGIFYDVNLMSMLRAEYEKICATVR